MANPERKTVTMLKNEILKTEYDKDVDLKRQDLIIQSFFKYGPAKHNFGEHLVKALPTMSQCVCKYDETHNKEYLLDAMNYLMFEYMYPSYDDAYFKHTDSDGSAGIDGMSYNQIKEASK